MIYRETLLNLTSIEDNTYYTPARSPDGYDNYAWELIGNGGSGTIVLKLFATMEDDATPNAATTATTYVDITDDTFGVTEVTCGAGVVTRTLFNDNLEKLACFKLLRWQYVVNTAGADDASLKIIQAFRIDD